MTDPDSGADCGAEFRADSRVDSRADSSAHGRRAPTSPPGAATVRPETRDGPSVRRLFPSEPCRLGAREAPQAPPPQASPAPVAHRPTGTTRDRDRAVHRAAFAVIRIALEVIDGHRPPERARGVFTEPLVDMLRVLARESVPGRHLGAAIVRRVHCHSIDVPRADSIIPYEISATYSRGPRLFAVAARLEVKADRTRCTAIRLI